MKKLLLILILTMSLQSWAKADDIRDFEIEGMSVGDSLLDYFSENEIKKQLSRTSGTYKSDYIKRVWFNLSEPELYPVLNIHFINDKNYELVSIGGIHYYRNDMPTCYRKMDEIIKDLEKDFPNSTKSTLEISNHASDKTGKSKVRDMWFELTNGTVYINCTDWSEEMTSERGWTDELGVYIETFQFRDWINNEAHN